MVRASISFSQGGCERIAWPVQLLVSLELSFENLKSVGVNSGSACEWTRFFEFHHTCSSLAALGISYRIMKWFQGNRGPGSTSHSFFSFLGPRTGQVGQERVFCGTWNKVCIVKNMCFAESLHNFFYVSCQNDEEHCLVENQKFQKRAPKSKNVASIPFKISHSKRECNCDSFFTGTPKLIRLNGILCVPIASVRAPSAKQASNQLTTQPANQPTNQPLTAKLFENPSSNQARKRRVVQNSISKVTCRRWFKGWCYVQVLHTSSDDTSTFL